MSISNISKKPFNLFLNSKNRELGKFKIPQTVVKLLIN